LDPGKSQVIPALCRKAILYPKEPFIVWGSGNQRRSFVYIDDIIDALVDVRTRGMNKGVIQIGTDHSDSIADIAKKIMSISGKDINIQFDIDKPEGDVDRAADCSKAKQILDWSPKVSIDKGLEKTYEWCLTELG
jgi:GDP-D-mannose 3',5'-epimerase